MIVKCWYSFLTACCIPCVVIFAQDVGEVMWADNFNDQDSLAHYEVGWFYYDASDGLMDALVEQRNGALYFRQGTFQILGVTLAGTNGVPFLETDEHGDWTEETKEALKENNFSGPNQECTFQLTFQSITSSWFIAPTRMIQDDDLTDSNPQESPSYLIFISPLEGIINLAKTPQEPLVLLDPGYYQWLADAAAYAFEIGVPFWIKYYLFEGIYKVKVWKGDVSEEPAAWLIEAVDPEPRVTGEFTYFALLNPDPAGKDEMLIDNITMREVNGGSVSVTTSADVPASFMLEQNYPNPFNSQTEILYSINKPADVRLAVFNQAGQMVRELVRARQRAGIHRIVWDGFDAAGMAMPSGLYWARLTGDGTSRTIRMLLIK